MSDCPTNEVLLAFCEGQLQDAALAELEAHVDRCAVCRTVVALGGLDATPPPPEPVPGQTLGRWKLLRILGSGAGGTVFAAHDEQLQRDVALKVLQARDDTGETRGLEEAQAMAQVVHPNVVTLYGVDAIDGSVILSMALADGESLGDWLEQPRSWRQVLDAFVAAASGLGAAHDAGVTHGDFKPANVLIGSDGTVRVSDFGLSRFARRTPPTFSEATPPDITRSASEVDVGGGTMVSGTPAFMAPELFLGHPPTPASDVYALCVALYRALYGQRPFCGDTPKKLAAARAESQAKVPPRTVAPRALWRVVRRGLERDPKLRYASTKPLIAALQGVQRRRRRRAMLLGSAVAVSIAFAAGASVRGSPPRCEDAATHFDRHVSAANLESLRNALATNSRRSDPKGATFFERRIGEFREQWGQEYALACDASMPRDQGAQVLACLDVDLGRLGALVDTFAGREDKVTRLASAVDTLPALAHCREPDEWPESQTPEAKQVRRDFAVARALVKAKEFDAATESLARVRADAEGLGDTRLLVDILNDQAGVAMVQGDFSRAGLHLDEAIEHSWGKRLPSSASQTATLKLELATFSSDFEAVDRWIARANRSQGLVGGDWKRGYDVSRSIARAELERGRPVQARDAATRALELSEQAAPRGDRHVQALLLVGNTYLANRSPDEAIGFLERAVSISEQSQDVSTVSASVAAADLAAALAANGQPGRARPLLLRAQRGLKPYLGVDDQTLMLTRLARLDVAEGQPEAALQRLQGVLPTLSAGSRAIPVLHGMRGMALRELGRHEEAAEAFASEASARAVEGSGSLGRAIALSNRSGELVASDRCDEALPAAEAARSIYAGLGPLGHHGRWSAESQIAACLNIQGQPPKVLASLSPILEQLDREVEPTDSVAAAVRLEVGRAMVLTGATEKGAELMREQIATLRALDQADLADDASAWLERQRATP